MQDATFKKRIIFIIIYIILFGLAGYFLYKLITPAPTCFDKKQNQNERGVDCGGQCAPCKNNIENQDLQIKETAFVDGGNGTYDVVAKITNPNYMTGADSFAYTFSLKDISGTVIAESSGKSFILPADTKYIPEIGIRVENGKIPSSVEIKITDINWKELVELSNPQLEVNNKKYQKNATGIGSEVSGVVKNNSSYDLNLMNIAVVVRDQNEKVIAINMTKKENIRAKEERSFLVTWSNNFKSEVAKIDIEAQSNIYEILENSVQK